MRSATPDFPDRVPPSTRTITASSPTARPTCSSCRRRFRRRPRRGRRGPARRRAGARSREELGLTRYRAHDAHRVARGPGSRNSPLEERLRLGFRRGHHRVDERRLGAPHRERGEHVDRPGPPLLRVAVGGRGPRDEPEAAGRPHLDSLFRRGAHRVDVGGGEHADAVAGAVVRVRDRRGRARPGRCARSRAAPARSVPTTAARRRRRPMPTRSRASEWRSAT